MNIFGIGLPEMAVIAAIALLVFGPKRLPEMGKTLGRTLKGVQSASQEFEKEFRSALRTEEEDPLGLSPSSSTVTGVKEDEFQSAVSSSEGGITPSTPPRA
ncbi:MAG: TatA/E family twin arginine-targeting protein translocase [Cyanobacteriota bacterium]|jgi:sec-independent protein translocase protein TatA|nr:TatA/E family twin arginine-targeting protein translocase [Cyanobacteriota bacterium]